MGSNTLKKHARAVLLVALFVSMFTFAFYVKPVRSPPPPPVYFTVTPYAGYVNETFMFDGSGSLPYWNGTDVIPITDYCWNFGDGNATNTTTPIVYHTYTKMGVYNPTLTTFAGEIGIGWMMREVKATIRGDINWDFTVDIQDAALMGLYWHQRVPPAPANVDVNGDGIIDISDAAILGKNWLKHA